MDSTINRKTETEYYPPRGAFPSLKINNAYYLVKFKGIKNLVELHERDLEYASI